MDMNQVTMGFFGSAQTFRHVCKECGKAAWGCILVGRTELTGVDGKWDLRMQEFCKEHLAEGEEYLRNSPSSFVAIAYPEYFEGPIPIRRGQALMLFPMMSPVALLELVTAARRLLERLDIDDRDGARLRRALEDLA